jgi:hypothetical protein
MATAYWLLQAIYVCGLLDRFLLDQKQEQEAEQINTIASYRSMICQHIRPKWGTYLEAVRPAAQQAAWLMGELLKSSFSSEV